MKGATRPATAPAYIPGYRRDGSPEAVGMNELLAGETIDRVEMGAVSAEGYSVTKLVLRSGKTVIVTPLPVPDDVQRHTGVRWATAWAVFHPRGVGRILLPGVGIPER